MLCATIVTVSVGYYSRERTMHPLSIFCWSIHACDCRQWGWRTTCQPKLLFNRQSKLTAGLLLGELFRWIGFDGITTPHASHMFTSMLTCWRGRRQMASPMPSAVKVDAGGYAGGYDVMVTPSKSQCEERRVEASRGRGINTSEGRLGGNRSEDVCDALERCCGHSSGFAWEIRARAN